MKKVAKHLRESHESGAEMLDAWSIDQTAYMDWTSASSGADAILRKQLRILDTCARILMEKANAAKSIFVGHGRSHVWRELSDFLQNRLHLSVQEFNSEATPGLTTVERLEQMLKGSAFAFLIVTAEDEHADATKHARANVIHEVGLFQGRLGFKRAIVMLEEGCQEFSNIAGLTQIKVPAWQH